MRYRRVTAILMILMILTVQAASAGLQSLDAALAPLLEGKGTVRMSVQLRLKTLMPFDQTRLDLLNRALSHAALDIQIADEGEDSEVGAQLSLGDTALFAFTEQYRNGAYLLQTSLLENRRLFSTQASPMDALFLSSQVEKPAPEISPGRNTSDVEEAFDMLAAMPELEKQYRALIDKTVPLTEKNTPNYNIEHIGRGRISYVARLTTEQSGELLPELRALLSCGMDAAYREELSQLTFGRGFVVALYQNTDGEDICVYIKGTVYYPDGDKRTLKWQWAFTPDRSTQTFLLEAARESGTRDSRVIEAIWEQSESAGAFIWEGKTTANLRRGGLNETSTLTVDLQGMAGEPMTCAGSVIRKTERTSGGENTGKTETAVTVDLALADTADGAELSGSAVYAAVTDQITQTELELTFLKTAQAQTADPAEGNVPAVEITLTTFDPEAARYSATTLTETTEQTQDEMPEFLVGTPPVGLYAYTVPGEVITVNMDTVEPKIIQSLMNEAAQQLAGHLVLAMLDLPAEDRQLLADGMTDTDYAIFLAMLD